MDIFEDDDIKMDSIGEVDPTEPIVSIDMEQIDSEAIKVATSMCKDLVDVYFNDDFMKDHPNIKRRLDSEIESLRVLVKMRKADEQVHDLAVQAIGANAANASLYRSLSQIQGSLLSIQKQIDETVRNIQNLCKNCQLDINFEQDQNTNTEGTPTEDAIPIHRGAKSFIEEMQETVQQERLETEEENE